MVVLREKNGGMIKSLTMPRPPVEPCPSVWLCCIASLKGMATLVVMAQRVALSRLNFTLKTTINTLTVECCPDPANNTQSYLSHYTPPRICLHTQQAYLCLTRLSSVQSQLVNFTNISATLSKVL